MTYAEAPAFGTTIPSESASAVIGQTTFRKVGQMPYRRETKCDRIV